jgi:hypothetical protein
MTMTQQEKDALRQNWTQAKQQVAQQFPNANLDDNADPDQVANDIAAKTGQDVNDVEKSLKQIAQQYTKK